MEITTKQELAEEAFELDRKIDKCLLNIRDNFLELGEIAAKLKQGKMYRLVCPEARSWEHYISLRFSGIKRASLDNYAKVFNTIGEYIKDKDIKINRAIDIARIVGGLPEPERKAKIDKLITDAEVLPKQGWGDVVRIENNKRPSDECSHDNLENWQKCKRCSKWFKL